MAMRLPFAFFIFLKIETLKVSSQAFLSQRKILTALMKENANSELSNFLELQISKVYNASNFYIFIISFIPLCRSTNLFWVQWIVS